MKVFKSVFMLLIVASMLLAACGGAPSAPTSADLFVVVGNYASNFAGNGNGDGLLLDQFRKENKVSIYVQVANDREMKDFKDQMVNNTVGAPDIMIADDSLLVDNLQNVKLIASHHVGIAIRNDIADSLGLQGNVIPFADYAQYSKNGQLLVVGSNALAGYDTAEFFFSTMAWCSNTDAANLTAEIIQQEYVRQCGKEIYDHIKSTNGSNEAAQLVMNAGSNGYNSLIAFDSVLMGDNGLNSRGDKLFKFFYFKEATAKAKIAIGTKDFGKDQAKKDSANLLIEYFLSDNSQKEINLAGFTEGSSALVEHYDTAFKPEWGVSSNPVGVQIVNPPLSNVATNALLIYRNMYKRIMELDVYIDVSGSTTADNELLTITLPAGIKAEDGNKYCGINKEIVQGWINSKQIESDKEFQYQITKLQAMACAVETFTNTDWLKANGISFGPNDVIRFWFFTDYVTKEPVAIATGNDISLAGQKVISLIGPTHSPINEAQISANLSQFLAPPKPTELQIDTPFVAFGGTWMFDAVKYGTEKMLPEYDSNKDYYPVILTDGANNSEATTDGNGFYDYWKSLEKPNITPMGIQFGVSTNPFARSDVDPSYTQKFGGNSFEGTSSSDLVKAFKTILGN